MAAAQAQASFPGPNGVIVFSRTPSGNQAAASDLYTVNPDGTGVTRLTSSGRELHPAWSPDSKRIAFEFRSLQGTTTIMLMDASGAAATPLAEGEGQPAWSADGTRLAFSWNHFGNDDVWAIGADGSGLVNLSQNTGLDYGPAWSPDGSKIAFAAIRTGNLDGDLYVMNADGSGQVDVTNTSAALELGPPSWSPDGTKIAFSVYHDGIYVMNADGSGRLQLTTNSLGDVEPAWSPDGKQIVFSRQYPGDCTAPPTPTAGGQCRLLWIMNADGTGQRQLTDNPGGGDASPSWGSAPAVVPPPPEDVIGREQARSPVGAFAGRVAWSSFDPATRRYTLVTWIEGLTAPQKLPVKPRTVPFDVDLGPDAHGHTVAVYSRCRTEPVPLLGVDLPVAYDSGRGCHLYIYDFLTRHESRINSAAVSGGSDFLPTIWGSRIAFARVWEQRKGKAGSYTYLYTRLLGRKNRSLRLPGGPAGDWTARVVKHKVRGYTGGPGPTSLDLRGKRLVFSWGWATGTRSSNLQRWTMVQLDTIGASGKRLAQARTDRTHQGVLTSASLGSDAVYWVAHGDPLSSPRLADSYRRYDLRSAAITFGPVLDGVAFAVRDDPRMVYLRGAPTSGYLVGRESPAFAAPAASGS